MNKLRFLLIFFSLIMICVCFQIFGSVSFIIVRGDSMEPTLSSGDILIAKRLSISSNISLQNSKVRNALTKFIFPAGNNTIKSNDIVILNQPYKYQKRIVKRCIGLPGDLVCIKSIDSILVYHKNATSTLYTSKFPLGLTDHRSNTFFSNIYKIEKEDDLNIERRIRIPSNGYQIQLRESNYNNYKDIFNRYARIDFDKVSNEFYKNGNIIDNYEFDQNYFFMLGDNMSISQDSRQSGAFPEEFIFGKVLLVLYPFKR